MPSLSFTPASPRVYILPQGLPKDHQGSRGSRTNPARSPGYIYAWSGSASALSSGPKPLSACPSLATSLAGKGYSSNSSWKPDERIIGLRALTYCRTSPFGVFLSSLPGFIPSHVPYKQNTTLRSAGCSGSLLPPFETVPGTGRASQTQER